MLDIFYSQHICTSPLFPRLQYLQISDNLLLLPRWRHEPLTGRVSIRPDTRLYSYTDLHQCALLLLVLMLCYDVHYMPSLYVRHNLTSILFFMGVKELFMQFVCSQLFRFIPPGFPFEFICTEKLMLFQCSNSPRIAKYELLQLFCNGAR